MHYTWWMRRPPGYWCLSSQTLCVIFPIISLEWAWTHGPLQSRKRQKLSKHIPESKYVSSKYDAEIVHLADMQHESILLRAQIDSIKREPTLLSSPGKSRFFQNPDSDWRVVQISLKSTSSLPQSLSWDWHRQTSTTKQWLPHTVSRSTWQIFSYIWRSNVFAYPEIRAQFCKT